MALDNAQFISELSILDPPGSDPLSQGDDQIRTTKRATFQSFPFIDKQIDLTADQMNLAAIKNEANQFTVQNQQFVDENIIQRSTDTALARWRYRDENSDVQWETYMAAGPGNNFILQRRNNGTFVDQPINVDWTTGVVEFAHVPTIQGVQIWTAGELKMLVQGSTLPGGNWFEANGSNGTVDLRTRFLAAQGAFTGTQSPFLQAQTAGGNTGSTAITESQMPSHRHSLRDLQTGGGITDGTALSSCNSVSGVRNVTANIFRDAGLSGNFVENTGGGSGHTHSIASQDVNTIGNDEFQIVPYAYFAIFVQYVP